MNIKTIVTLLGLISSIFVYSQEEEKIDTLNVLDQRVTLLEDANQTAKKFKLSGYIQAQWESADSLGSTKVGAGKAASETHDFNRFGIRRGRLKATYTDEGVQGALELDITEKSIGIKDVYLSALDPWIGIVSLKGGVYDRPFGYEIAYSSSKIESPERSRMIQTLFPDEKDLGGMLTFQAPKTSAWNPLKLEIGLFAGNGIYLDTDSKKDLIGHLSYNKTTPNSKYGLGVSFYSGSVAQSTKNIYKMNNGLFVVDSTDTNKNGFANRQYLGFDGQFSINTGIGLTTIRGEYILGQQPGRSDNSSSPKSGLIPGFDSDNKTAKPTDTYIRNFSGAYVHLVQDIGDTKHSLTVKYDYYDPNTDIAGMNIGTGSASAGIAKTNKTDVAYQTIGFGYMYRMNANVRLMAYYDMNINEKTTVSGYTVDRPDNVLTIRLQYKF